MVANRGEIALRIIRACKEMGIKSVAIYPANVDKEQFLETKFADEAYCLDEEGMMGYLNQTKIIQIAKKAEADAIHPGYGFLAENGDFAELCKKNKVRFIGPSSKTLRKLGNKMKAIKIAKEVGLPLLSSSLEPVNTEKECKEIAKKTEFPFLLKAANGGGGVGIKVVDKQNKDQLIETFNKLKREAKNAFGSDEVFIEKFFENPRHIEFQILGDGKGNVVHLGERECSIQRRHQKLVEEAPSPFIDDKLRKKMGKLAVKFGEYLNYKGSATIEFLVGGEKEFYFLEVNPRLQVEHSVTELITGVDIVKNQIKIAQGETLELRQKDIKFHNHVNWAMEFRINAEEALKDFTPKTGTVKEYLPPAGRGVEVHSFCRPGQKIFPYFDNLISKLVVFGEDRKDCLKKADRALEEYVIRGVPTLIPFFRALLDNKNFSRGRFSTSFIRQEKIVETLKANKDKYYLGEDAKPKASSDLEEEELAKAIAKFYLQLGDRKQESSPTKNKWKFTNRQVLGVEPFRSRRWK